jgi:hypothetical protein
MLLPKETKAENREARRKSEGWFALLTLQHFTYPETTAFFNRLFHQDESHPAESIECSIEG